ncbi:MAG: MarR family transcriptional regulator [Alphaproteobacteria bacterium]|nr:MarR family transcriptional regulator [Alphaproteobacteria bacterium]MCL2758119.1 MarR family transcriptional regulator [Alphaproteobacteria bacterium]
MPERAVTRLFQNIIISLGWLSNRINTESHIMGHSRQYLRVLLQLHISGRSLLKNTARQTDISASNLCPMLKIMEQDGLVSRKIDEEDRRNVWYSLTPAGKKIAEKGMLEMRVRIAKLFSGLNQKDEARLTAALSTLDEILNSIKENYKE